MKLSDIKARVKGHPGSSAEHFISFAYLLALAEELEMKLAEECEAHEQIAKILLPLVGTTDGTSVGAARAAESEVERLRAERDGLREDLEIAKIPFCESPCGHSSQFCHTEDGGKSIDCYACEVLRLRAELAKRDEAARELLDWVPVCSPGSSGYIRTENLRKLVSVSKDTGEEENG